MVTLEQFVDRLSGGETLSVRIQGLRPREPPGIPEGDCACGGLVLDAVRCHFDEADRPRVVRLHVVRDEVLPV